MDLPSNIILTVVKTGCIRGWKHIGAEDYDAVRRSNVMKRNIFSVLQTVFADGAFDPTKSRRFELVLL